MAATTSSPGMHYRKEKRVSPSRSTSRMVAIATLVAGLLLSLAALPARADAVVAWDSFTAWGPTVLQPGQRGGVSIEIGNVGDEQAVGWPTVQVGLPPGVAFDVHDSGSGFGWA